MKDDEAGPADGGSDDKVVGEEATAMQEAAPSVKVEDPNRTTQFSLEDIESMVGVQAPEEPAMEVSVLLQTGAAEAVAVEDFATRQMDLAVLAGVATPTEDVPPAGYGIESEEASEELSAASTKTTAPIAFAAIGAILDDAALAHRSEGQVAEELQSFKALTGSIVSNVERDDASLETTIRSEMQDLLSGMQDYIRSDRSLRLDTRTRVALSEFADELAQSLLGDLTEDEMPVDSPDESESAVPEPSEHMVDHDAMVDATIRCEIPEGAIEALKAMHEAGQDPLDAMQTMRFEASALPGLERVLEVPDSGQLRRMTPVSNMAAVPASSAKEEPAEPALAGEDLQFAQMPPASGVTAAQSEPAEDSNRGFLIASMVLFVVIAALAGVASYLLWRDGHLQMIQDWLESM